MTKEPMVKGSVKINASTVFEATLLNDFEAYSSGSLLMRLSDTDLHVMDGDKKLGDIGIAIGGTMYVTIGSRTWSLDPMQIFEAVRQAEKEQYLKTTLSQSSS